jgi:hypothetical protein
MLEKIENLRKLIDMPLNEINKKIENAEIRAIQNCKEIKGFAEKFSMIYVTVDEKSAISRYIKESIGLYAEPSYKNSLKKYTSQIEANYGLFYLIIDAIGSKIFYNLLGAKVESKKVKLSNVSKYDVDYFKKGLNCEVIKEYINGSVDFSKSDDLLKVIELIKEIYDYFNTK